MSKKNRDGENYAICLWNNEGIFQSWSPRSIRTPKETVLREECPHYSMLVSKIFSNASLSPQKGGCVQDTIIFSHGFGDCTISPSLIISNCHLCMDSLSLFSEHNTDEAREYGIDSSFLSPMELSPFILENERKRHCYSTSHTNGVGKNAFTEATQRCHSYQFLVT
jgi:hypothetical protein